MKSIKFFILVSTILFMASSCNKSQDEGSGTGDAIIVAKKSGTNTVYGLSLYAYSFSSFQSVKATSSADATKTYTLKENQGYKTNFSYEAPDAEFTTTKPVASTFNFSAVFENGVTNEFQDNLTDKVLAVPVIEKSTYDATTTELTTTWASVTDADSYAINILDGSTLVFGSLELVNTIKSFTLNSTSSGWITGVTPVVGKTYTLRLNAYLYEPNGNTYNMQAVSMAEKPIVWGK
jgi:hypothetical protein